ncbi:MAG TPA: hypothetical protein VFK44_06570, partial [Bacillales bacterium]|nr:hypothetical protein [Bacillales bacterium]
QMSSFHKDEKASITLEAAMVVPVFLLFVVFLAGMIRIGVAEIALNRAVSDTTEVLATHTYPAELAVSGVQGTLDTFIQDRSMGSLDLAKASEIFNMAMKTTGVDFSPEAYLSQLASDRLITPMVRKKFAESILGKWSDPNRIKVVDVTVTDGFKGALSITAQYRMHLIAPFVDKQIILKKRAYEYLWSPH